MWGLGGQLNTLGLLLPASDLQVEGSCAGMWLPVTIPVSPCPRQPSGDGFQLVLVLEGGFVMDNTCFGQCWCVSWMCSTQLVTKRSFPGIPEGCEPGTGPGVCQLFKDTGRLERTLISSEAWKCYEVFLWLKSDDALRGIKWWRRKWQGRMAGRCWQNLLQGFIKELITTQNYLPP